MNNIIESEPAPQLSKREKEAWRRRVHKSITAAARKLRGVKPLRLKKKQ